MTVITGVVQGGVGRATTLGFPTANISLEDSGASGVYAAFVGIGGTEYRAVAFADPKRGILEVHILDVVLDVRGKEIGVRLLRKLRDSRKFEDDAALRAAIADDVARVREYFETV